VVTYLCSKQVHWNHFFFILQPHFSPRTRPLFLCKHAQSIFASHTW
jgi:hypothetical protein